MQAAGWPPEAHYQSLVPTAPASTSQAARRAHGSLWQRDAQAREQGCGWVIAQVLQGALAAMISLGTACYPAQSQDT